MRAATIDFVAATGKSIASQLEEKHHGPAHSTA
jgi:hypothetical protein